MKGDKIYRAIGDADEKYIKSAEAAFGSGKSREKRQNAGRIIKRVLSVAAAVVIIGGLWVVSFIVTQKRQDPNTSANTGESTFEDSETSLHDNTNGEPDTEADTAHVLSPSDTDHIEIDPDSVCGKMIQSFDEYLKAKERGKYGDYYVSYCVKVNGAYIGFITDGDTDYTQALENEVIDGLPFCYGNGQKLTVINGGEYRYGLAEAFNDGLLNSDKLDQFFVIYSSDHKLYKEFESEYLRQSYEEFLDGEDERNVIDKPKKDKELTLYNYIHIAYCKKLGDHKYAVLYQLTHQPIEDSTDEYFTVSAGGYDFPVNVGLRLNIYENGGVYGLGQAQLSDNELKALYDSYTEFMKATKKVSEETRENDTTDTPFIDVEFEWLDFTNTDRITDAEKAKELSGVFDEYLRGEPNPGIDFCVKLGNGKYAALLERHQSMLCVESTENAGGYPILYGSDRKMIVLSGNTVYYGLQNAYERDVLTYDDTHKLFMSYRDAFPGNYEGERFCSLLRQCAYEYLNGSTLAFTGSGNEGKLTYGRYIDMEFCAELSPSKYAVLYCTVWPAHEFYEKTEDVNGYEFLYQHGLELKILDIDKISGLSDASLTDSELKSLYGSYEKYVNENIYGEWNVPKIIELFDSFDKHELTSYLNRVDFAYKTEDGVYIGLLANGDHTRWKETVAGCTFEHTSSNKFFVIKDNTLTKGLKEAYESGIISDKDVKEFYTNLIKIYQ